MGIGEKIRHLRKELGLSRGQLAEMIHVTPSAIANYENGISTPKPENLISLLRALQVDANYLYQDYLSDSRERMFCGRELTEDEEAAVLRYCGLTAESKKLVQVIINTEYERQAAENWIQYPCIRQGGQQTEYGFLLEQEKYTVRFQRKYQVEGMEFCFQMRGDQCEPMYKDRTVLALKQASARHNEIGIFKLDGIYYLRMLCLTEGKCRLRALNANEPDIEVDDGKKIECIGTILGQICGTCEIL